MFFVSVGLRLLTPIKIVKLPELIAQITSETTRDNADIKLYDRDQKYNWSSLIYFDPSNNLNIQLPTDPALSISFGSKDIKKSIDENLARYLNQSFISSLERNNFKKDDAHTIKYIGSNVDYVPTLYTDGEYLCQVELGGTWLPSLNCIRSSDIQNKVTLANEFNKAYVASSFYQKDDNPISIGVNKVEDSSTAGYKIATASIGTFGQEGGAVMDLYQKDGVWKVFRIAQGPGSCDEYDKNPDAKAAYKGVGDCIDQKTNSEIKI